MPPSTQRGCGALAGAISPCVCNEVSTARDDGRIIEDINDGIPCGLLGGGGGCGGGRGAAPSEARKESAISFSGGGATDEYIPSVAPDEAPPQAPC